jgi:hypothetical protein
MPYQLRWYNDQHTAILRTLLPGWTWDDYEKSYLEAFDMIKTVKHTVDLVADYEDSPEAPPSEGGMMSEFSKVWSERPKNLGLFILVGAGDFHKSMAEVFLKTFADSSDSVRFVTSRVEADEILAGR